MCTLPGQLDFIPTMQAAIAFCQAVNERVGRRVMVINLEFAHALIGGQTVTEAVKMQIAAGMFDGLVHVNSAEKASLEWNETGTEIVCGTPGDDADWAVGEGGKERWDDQQTAIQLLKATGQLVAAEHDIDPAGEAPDECYARSRANLEVMWVS